MKKCVPVLLMALCSLANAQTAIKPTTPPPQLHGDSGGAPMTAEQANAILVQLMKLNVTETQILQATLASKQRDAPK